MPRFVILEHDHPYLHWDLMIERDDVLDSWRLLQLPEAGISIPALSILRHRKLFLDYEGPVSGNRGSVRRWDFGSYSVIAERPEHIALEIRGNHVRGRAHLRHESEDQWTFRFDDLGPQR